MMLFIVSGALAWAVASDYQSSAVVPMGVTIAGQDLSGMTQSQARSAIEEAVSAPMLKPVTVAWEKRKWSLDPAEFVVIDVDAMLQDAYTSRRSATLLARLNSDLRGTPLEHDVEPVYSVDTTALAEWVAQTSKEVNRRPIDSTRTIEKYAFKIKPAIYGAKVNKKQSAKDIAAALSAESALAEESRTVSLTVGSIKPKVVESDFKRGIIVSLAQCRVFLYNGDKLVKTYRCAPGRAAFPTPQGDFRIVSKLRFAPWINPGSDWAKDMPKIIPGGPNNPMGVTKMGIDVRGIYFHGIPPSEFSSIGTHASHGCMRMMPSDVLDLYGRVAINDPVYIRP